MPVVHPERPDSTCAAAGAPRSSICLVGPTHARAAHCCLPATGPRATTCAAADKPGLVSGLLCVNFLIVPTFLLLLSSCRVEVSGCVMPLRRVVPGECVVMSVHGMCRLGVVSVSDATSAIQLLHRTLQLLTTDPP